MIRPYSEALHPEQEYEEDKKAKFVFLQILQTAREEEKFVLEKNFEEEDIEIDYFIESYKIQNLFHITQIRCGGEDNELKYTHRYKSSNNS